MKQLWKTTYRVKRAAMRRHASLADHEFDAFYTAFSAALSRYGYQAVEKILAIMAGYAARLTEAS